MPPSRRKTAFLPLDDTVFSVKQRKPVPHEFVLDALAPLSPRTRSMFGCLAIYVEDKIVLILRNKDKPGQTADNGVWLATTEEHHQSLRRDFPSMRSLQVLMKNVLGKNVLGKKAVGKNVLAKQVTGWQLLPADAENFEEAALRACELVLAGDPRIGKVPGARRAKPPKKAAKRRAP